MCIAAHLVFAGIPLLRNVTQQIYLIIIYLFTYLFICLFICLFIYLFIYTNISE